MSNNSLANAVIRSALAEVILGRLQELDLPSRSTSFAEACRIGTTKVEAVHLAVAVEQALRSRDALPGGSCLVSGQICALFPEAWKEAVRRSGVVPALLDWDDNGQEGAECEFLFGYLDAVRVPEPAEG